MTEKPSYEVLETNAATQQHINLVRILLRKMGMEVIIRGETHDLSKFEAEEVDTFVEFTPKLKTSTYGSDEYKGFLTAMGPALQHHYLANRHHPEHFTSGMAGMNLVDLLECFVDWYASGKRHADGDIMKSIEVNQKRFDMPPMLVSIFRNTAKDFFPEEFTEPPEDSRPKPQLVKGPNTWVCQDCTTQQPPPSVEDFTCQALYKYVPHSDPAIEAIRKKLRSQSRNGTLCESEDIFDMNDPSWPCPNCQMPSVTYLDMKAMVVCESCWETGQEDGFIGL